MIVCGRIGRACAARPATKLACTGRWEKSRRAGSAVIVDWDFADPWRASFAVETAAAGSLELLGLPAAAGFAAAVTVEGAFGDCIDPAVHGPADVAADRVFAATACTLVPTVGLMAVLLTADACAVEVGP